MNTQKHYKKTPPHGHNDKHQKPPQQALNPALTIATKQATLASNHRTLSHVLCLCGRGSMSLAPSASTIIGQGGEGRCGAERDAAAHLQVVGSASAAHIHVDALVSTASHQI